MFGTKEMLARRVRTAALFAGAWLMTLPIAATASAAPGSVTVNVKSPSATSPNIGVGFRWLLEEDSTWPVTPGDATAADAQALNLHKSHMTVVAQGRSTGAGSTSVPVPDTGTRYFLSILPDEGCATGGCFTMSGRQITPELFVAGTSPTLVVTVPAQPTPTAQIFGRAFQDSAPINGTWDDAEAP